MIMAKKAERRQELESRNMQYSDSVPCSDEQGVESELEALLPRGQFGPANLVTGFREEVPRHNQCERVRCLPTGHYQIALKAGLAQNCRRPTWYERKVIQRPRGLLPSSRHTGKLKQSRSKTPPEQVPLRPHRHTSLSRSNTFAEPHRTAGRGSSAASREPSLTRLQKQFSRLPQTFSRAAANPTILRSNTSPGIRSAHLPNPPLQNRVIRRYSVSGLLRMTFCASRF
ncbi:unnamed protein product [Dibothriocephalus latus]|uniref:Uncharacterized protein n=1 Tax=Dibothriocephalus latus TaxID=60516 RepID=A0A3P6TND2_DIBLA|nr:unnamed protein product [Dibothriocephalus latus]